MLLCYRPQQSWGKIIFSEAWVKNSVHRGEVVSQQALQVSRPTPVGGLQAHTQGGECVPACTEADPPTPSRQLLLRAVRILLECILVFHSFPINTFQTLKAQDATIQTASLYDWSWVRWMSSKGYAGYIDKELDCR